MDWNHFIRQVHRWMSAAFVAAIVVTSIALAQSQPIAWLTYLPLLPLALLLLTGVYLFMLPYAAKWRRPRRAT